MTSLGYSGEHFDAKAQQQYLRARWYGPASGRFNRLDPFAGNMLDPQSLHKYAYVHGDPVNGVDPSGLLVAGGLTSTMSTTSVMTSMAATAIVFRPVYDIYASHVDRELLTELARRLDTELLDRTTVRRQTENQSFKYFVHGTTTNSWLSATSFVLDVGPTPRALDFGIGFYTRLADPRGIKEVSEWANAKAMTPFGGGSAVVFLLGVRADAWQNMSKKNYGTPEEPSPSYVPDVNAYRQGDMLLSGMDVVLGPTAKYDGVSWVVNPNYSNQYKFEPSAFPHIVLVGIFPALPDYYLA